MRQAFTTQRQRDSFKPLSRLDLADMLRRLADSLSRHSEVFTNDPNHCAGETDANPPRFEISAMIYKNDKYPAYIRVCDFEPKNKL